MILTLIELTWEYQEWCAERGCSDEGDPAQYLGASCSDEDRAWLTDFITRWDNAISGQEYADVRTDEDWKTHAE